jgi:hypothetical protein
MAMSLGDRLGVWGLIVALLGIAASILWPDKKWIGWLCLTAAVSLLAMWLWFEFRLQIPNFYQKYPTKSTLTVFMVGGVLAASVWLLVMKGTPAIPKSLEDKPSSGSINPPNTETHGTTDKTEHAPTVQEIADALAKKLNSKPQPTSPEPRGNAEDEKLATDALQVAAKLRAMFEQADAAQMAAYNKNPKAASLESEEVRAIAWQLFAEYRSHYEHDAIRLRDEMLSRLPSGSRNDSMRFAFGDDPKLAQLPPQPRTYVVRVFELNLIADELERLAKLLQRQSLPARDLPDNPAQRIEEKLDTIKRNTDALVAATDINPAYRLSSEKIEELRQVLATTHGLVRIHRFVSDKDSMKLGDQIRLAIAGAHWDLSIGMDIMSTYIPRGVTITVRDANNHPAVLLQKTLLQMGIPANGKIDPNLALDHRMTPEMQKDMIDIQIGAAPDS